MDKEDPVHLTQDENTLILHEHLFKKNGVPTERRTYWVCRSVKCNVRAIQDKRKNVVLSRSSDQHNHDPQGTTRLLHRKSLIEQMKMEMEVTGKVNESFERVIEHNPESRGLFKGVHSVESSLKRTRKKEGVVHPKDESEIVERVVGTKFELNYYGAQVFGKNPAEDKLTVEQYRAELSAVNLQILKLEQRRKRVQAMVQIKTDSSKSSLFFRKPGERGNILFVSDEALHILSEATIVTDDGTFKVTPTIPTANEEESKQDDSSQHSSSQEVKKKKKKGVAFGQLFVFHGVFEDRNKRKVTIPLAYGLLKGKNTEDYKEFFNQLDELMKEKNLSHDWEILICDFEKALWNAARETILKNKNTVIQGCFFHKNQANMKKARELGLTKLFRQNKQMYSAVRRLLMCALLPVDKVETVSNVILDEIQEMDAENESLGSFIQYYKNTWFQRFRVSDWNFFHVQNRTNNLHERWNRNFASKCGIHPSLLRFIQHIQQEDRVACEKYHALVHGCLEVKKRKKSRQTHHDMINICWSQLESGQIEEFEFVANCAAAYAKMYGDEFFDTESCSVCHRNQYQQELSHSEWVKCSQPGCSTPWTHEKCLLEKFNEVVTSDEIWFCQNHKTQQH